MKVYTDLVQVDDIELLASNTMEQAAFVIEEDDFHRLEFLCKLSSGNISVDVENLTGFGLG